MTPRIHKMAETPHLEINQLSSHQSPRTSPVRHQRSNKTDPGQRTATPSTTPIQLQRNPKTLAGERLQNGSLQCPPDEALCTVTGPIPTGSILRRGEEGQSLNSVRKKGTRLRPRLHLHRCHVCCRRGMRMAQLLRKWTESG